MRYRKSGKEENKMKIYIICPVRNVTDEQQREIDNYVKLLKSLNHEVHNPKYDAPQEDESGWWICEAHRAAMKKADRVDVFWDIESKGSHFDLGMAFAFTKQVKIVKLYHPDTNGKSYVKVMEKMG